MKTLNRLFVFSFFFFFYVGVCIGQNDPNPAQTTAGLLTDPAAVVGGALALYEIVVRAVPTVKKWSILGKVINWLKAASDILNVVKKVKKS
jgi:hypothetical protein